MSDTAREIERYSVDYGAFIDEMRAEVDEFIATGEVKRARELSARAGEDFSHSEWPHYFTGDLDASLVLVHLNPKRESDPRRRVEGPGRYKTFEDYFDAYRHFGAHRYGPESPRTHRSPFDHKQIRFLRPFGVIDFLEGRRPEDRFANLERVIDQKLQLELIPYASVSFSSRGFDDETLRPHYARIMRVIAARRRSFVLFCGGVFEQLLARYVADQHAFRLQKNDGTPTRQRARYANLLLEHEGTSFHAGLAHSWAQQGIPMASYAEQIRERYRRP